MAKKPKDAPPPNKRGSPEAVAKRRAARAFNDLLDPRGPKMDGRTEKRKQRLLKELESGTTRGGRALKPIEILSHAHELLELGEDPATLRRLRKTRPIESDERLLDVLADLHRAYGFRVEAYAFVGIDEQALRRAKIIGRKPPRRKKPASSNGDAPPSRRRG